MGLKKEITVKGLIELFRESYPGRFTLRDNVLKCTRYGFDINHTYIYLEFSNHYGQLYFEHGIRDNSIYPKFDNSSWHCLNYISEESPHSSLTFQRRKKEFEHNWNALGGAPGKPGTLFKFVHLVRHEGLQKIIEYSDEPWIHEAVHASTPDELFRVAWRYANQIQQTRDMRLAVIGEIARKKGIADEHIRKNYGTILRTLKLAQTLL